MIHNNNKPIDKELNAELRGQFDNWKEVQEHYNRITGENRSAGTLSKCHSRYKRELQGVNQLKVEEPVHTSERYIEISTDELLTEDDVLELHGLDPTKWELTSTGSTRSKSDRAGGGDKNTYSIRTSHRINAKPIQFKVSEDNIDVLLSKTEIRPIKVEQLKEANDLLLVIPLFDMHFGNMTYKEYIKHQQRIAYRISRDEWEEVVFFIGQDLFHNDDFRGHTSNQTRIEKVDMAKAWEDAMKFYQPLIELALRSSIKTKIVYSPGNHDEVLGWSFTKALELRYPQVIFDCDMEVAKAITFYDVFVGVTHGDKLNDKKIVRVFEAKFRLAMAKAHRRVLLRGHLHTMKSFDDNGTHVYALGTSNKADQWHEDNGFIGNHKAFELFVFDRTTMLEHLFIE